MTNHCLVIISGFRLRSAIAVLTLFSHLMLTIGYPLPKPSQKSKDGIPYPCQNRPCGCVTSEECWKGDCCCFTMEEKLVWAENNGVEPPEHSRALVESRKNHKPAPKKKSCCSEAEPEVCEVKDDECPHCVAKAKPDCCEKKQPVKTGFRWVLGVYAQKCRGEGSSGPFQLEPATIPEFSDLPTVNLENSPREIPRSEQTTSISFRPPSHPPRFS